MGKAHAGAINSAKCNPCICLTHNFSHHPWLCCMFRLYCCWTLHALSRNAFCSMSYDVSCLLSKKLCSFEEMRALLQVQNIARGCTDQSMPCKGQAQQGPKKQAINAMERQAWPASFLQPFLCGGHAIELTALSPAGWMDGGQDLAGH